MCPTITQLREHRWPEKDLIRNERDSLHEWQKILKNPDENVRIVGNAVNHWLNDLQKTKAKEKKKKASETA